MFDPYKRVGSGEKEEGPALVVAIGKPKTKPKFGGYDPNKHVGSDPEMGSDDDTGGDPDELMNDLAVRFCKALNVGSDRAPRVKELLEAFFHAADSKPHDEGEDTGEDKEEEN